MLAHACWYASESLIPLVLEVLALSDCQRWQVVGHPVF